MRPSIPKARRVVLIGGGHTHALILRRLAMEPIEDVLFTLVNPSPKAPYTGMLPGFIAGHYHRDDVEIDLIHLARASNVQLILNEVTGLDLDTKTIQLKTRKPITYDLASLNVGITSHLPKIEGYKKFGRSAKPLGTFAEEWIEYLAANDAQSGPRKITIIGGGVAGIELALSMAYHLKTIGQVPAHITILERDEEILRGTSPKTKARLMKHLQNAGVELKTNATIKQITQTEVQLADGTSVQSEFTVGAAGATPHKWISKTGLLCHDGFVKTNAALQTLTDKSVFACGDCAHFSPNPLPKAGVFAVRQAPILLENLKASLQGRPLTPYKPQKNYLKLISTGGRTAVADKFGLTFDGPLLWRLKDRIDRKFMNRLSNLPSMKSVTPEPLAVAAPKELLQKYQNLCGGCGAKMDSQHLSQILSKQRPNQRSDILSTPGDDAAILKHGHGSQVFTTDHLRAFTNDPWLMGKIAAVHALGDIWAMGANPQAALASIILPPMADHLHASMLDEILSAATQVLREAGANLVGGHTSIGSELTVGFSITGLSDKHPIQNTGAQPGDVLILTKPIGFGTILAAEMRGLADGYHVETAYQHMSRSSQKASELLAPSAHAMTDVTGFGLAGHLNQMMINSGTKATLIESQIPFLREAVVYADQGIKSSLWTSNRAALPNWAAKDTGKYALLFDPQTAGGLLASVPKETAKSIETALKDAGETPFIIGEVKDGPPGVHLA